MDRIARTDRSITLEEKQLRYLERNWEILEAFKQMRSRVPVGVVGTMLAITGYVLKSSLPASWPELVLVLLLLAILSSGGLWMLGTIQGQYGYTDDKIEHLYVQLGMDMESKEFSIPDRSMERAANIFRMARMFIAVTGAVCAVLILMRGFETIP